MNSSDQKDLAMTFALLMFLGFIFYQMKACTVEAMEGSGRIEIR